MTDGAPHIPARPERAIPDSVGFSGDRPRAERSLLAQRPDGVERYQEPELVSTLVAARALMAGRALLATWGVAVVVATAVVRSRAESHEVSASIPTVLGWIGLGVASIVAGTSWWWSDRHTVNVHRLDRKWPHRFRCVSAWSIPVLVPPLLMVTVLRIEPTEILDVRPAIVAMVFAAAMWRPYALCRRLLKSLTRIGSDALLRTAYLLDLAGLGLLWWQVGGWPDQLGPENVDTAAPVLGQALAAAPALIGGIGTWMAITRVLDAATEHRRSAHRTYFEHRWLRVRGINPMDPEVRWALHQLRVDESARRQALEAGSSSDDADRESRPSTIATGGSVGPVARPGGTDRVDALPSPGSPDDGRIGDPVMEREPGSDPNRTPDEREADRRQPHTVGSTSAHDVQASDPEPPADVDQGPRHAVEPLRAGMPDGWDALDADPEAPLQRRVFLLELVRYLLLLALLASAAMMVWLMVRASTSSRVGGEILPDDLSNLDTIRRAAFVAAGAALVLTPAWAWTSAIYIRRRGGGMARDVRSCMFAVLASTTAYAGALAVDPDATTVTALALLVEAVAAVAAVAIVRSVSVDVGGRPTAATAWSGLLLLIPTLWAAGLARTVDAQDGLDSILFFAASEAIVVGAIAIVAGAVTGMIGERLSRL